MNLHIDSVKKDKNIAIHCPTLEEAKAVLAIFSSNGLKWSNGSSYDRENLWNVYNSDTCYRPSTGSYCHTSYYDEALVTIVPAKDFLKANKQQEQAKTEEDFDEVQFKHKNDSTVYTISFEKRDFYPIKVSWDGGKQNVRYTLEEVTRNFESGIWIKIQQKSTTMKKIVSEKKETTIDVEKIDMADCPVIYGKSKVSTDVGALYSKNSGGVIFVNLSNGRTLSNNYAILKNAISDLKHWDFYVFDTEKEGMKWAMEQM